MSLGSSEAKKGFRITGLSRALLDSVKRLSPFSLIANPVMFIVEIAFFIVVLMAIYPAGFGPLAEISERGFYATVATILLFTVWFSTLADALAEQQARNTANSLRQLETQVISTIVITEGWSRKYVTKPSSEIKRGDIILVKKGEIVPMDAEVLEGIAMVDESLLTGESTAVKKAPGDVLIGGSRVISDTLTARVTVNPEDSYIKQMAKMVESSKRPKTANEKAITVVLIGLTAIFSVIILTLIGISLALRLGGDLSVFIALYVCLLPTTIGALLSAIGLSGISRLYKRKIVAKSGKAVETAGDVDIILLDKTGTITVGDREAVEFIPFEGWDERAVGEAAFLSSWYDDTPEGRSIIRLAYKRGYIPKEINELSMSKVYNFSASTRTSGIRLTEVNDEIRTGGKESRRRWWFSRKHADKLVRSTPLTEVEIMKGAPDAIRNIVDSVPMEFDKMTDEISSVGETPIAISKDGKAIGMIRLKDVLKQGVKGKIADLKLMGIEPIMITGDQPLTAESIAHEVGIDKYVPRAKPADKYDIVRAQQAESKIVAMIGDGTNDAPALSVADVGLAMNSGTEPAKEAANMIDLESNPAKVMDVVMLGKQLLMTRGAITTFSIANDVAKYFAIVPVLFAATIPQLQALNILGLGLHTAVLSTLIFNAAIIPALIPLAMRGISFKPANTMTLFLRNALIFGVGGVILPFIGIKAIDILLIILRI
ncbi:MAG: potassium-transporting ATPase subunit KdpB [Nitrososphaerota archaeon]|nr:potassium-transporting ATPase subunit KdpB [Nitrososphaerota archaeon]